MNDLQMVTIYDHPRDFPDHWVARAFTILRGVPPQEGEYRLAPTLEAAREAVADLVPSAGFCLARSPEDDPVIVETWI